MAATDSPSSPSSTRVLPREVWVLEARLESALEQLDRIARAADAGPTAAPEPPGSIRERLLVAKQELEIVARELQAVRGALAERTADAASLRDDFTNVLTGASMAVVLLDADARVRRFTPSAAALLRLSPDAVGRPIGAIDLPLRPPDLDAIVAAVFERLAPVQRVLRTEEGRWYQLSVNPYVTAERRIDGTVLTFVDVHALKMGEEAIAEERRHAQAIVDTLRERVLVLDERLRVCSANRSFYATLGASPAETEGRLLSEVGGGDWDVGELVTRLAGLGEGGHFEDVRFERRMPDGKHLVVMANARRLPGSAWTLLALEDVTARDEAERRIREYQARLRAAAFEAAAVEQRERRRIALGLHDRLGQSLAVTQMKLAAARDLTSGEPRALIEQGLRLVAASIQETRSLTAALCPPVLYDLGLFAALESLAEDLERSYGLHVVVEGGALDPAPDETAAAFMYRAARELLMNVLKHAGTREARMRVAAADGRVVVVVEDAGRGFDPGAPAASGFGLFSVREQIAKLGGTVEIASSPAGTRVTIAVPLDPARPPSGS